MKRPDLARVLNGLKDFQKDTARYVYQRLYEDPDATDRFLLADEVGLGKTIVAKAVIAQAIEHLWDRVERIDIVYICSNADIARQNIRRLQLEESVDTSLASRLTLLPLHVGELKKRKVNFVAFTPSTSLDLRSSAGTRQERILLYHLLQQAWSFGSAKAPMNVFQENVGTEKFRQRLGEFDMREVSTDLCDQFVAAVAKVPELRARFEDLCERFSRDKANIPKVDRTDRSQFVADARRLLARTCLNSLESDLIILDEFQRFKELLETDTGEQTEVARLAQDLFNYRDDRGGKAKVLLLSATPYKMFTVDGEDAEDHYSDFLKTAEFLFNSSEETTLFDRDLGRYRRALCLEEVSAAADGGVSELTAARIGVETRLRRVMCRTERLGTTADRNGMIQEDAIPVADIDSAELRAFGSVDRIARELDTMDSVELWKSAPYLLNFLDDAYSLKRKLRERLKARDPKISTLLDEAQPDRLNFDHVDEYAKLDFGNARLRALADASIDSGGWKLLWMPPALPYYEPAGAFEGIMSFTKNLVFSSWQVVPRAIAALCSYEAERRAIEVGGKRLRYDELHKEAQLLRVSEADGRAAGMPVLALMYPCRVLARVFDPAQCSGAVVPDLAAALSAVRSAVERILAPVVEKHAGTGAVDERWYWAAPFLLDAEEHGIEVRNWLSDREGGWQSVYENEDEDSGGFVRHLKEARELLQFSLEKVLGAPPADLVDVVARLALASPGVTCLRALERRWPGESTLKWPAAAMAWGFRTLFNAPDVTMLVRGLAKTSDRPYWREVLDYCVGGNLQAVMDEYVHVLNESLGVQESGPSAAEDMAEAVQSALTLRVTQVQVHDFTKEKEAYSIKERNIRSRFAVRFAKATADEDSQAPREDEVRNAFNSPFRPFVLATTSIGQEGLDFHHYCHRIWHWNLPWNPVDLEQREGRIHRFKSHFVRKNLAALHRGEVIGGSDPWSALFGRAVTGRATDKSDLEPYWLLEGPFGIERRVPVLPLSRDIGRLDTLKQSLALYRLVFGQPRQQELMELLKNRQGSAARDARIDLSPTRRKEGS